MLMDSQRNALPWDFWEKWELTGKEARGMARWMLQEWGTEWARIWRVSVCWGGAVQVRAAIAKCGGSPEGSRSLSKRGQETAVMCFRHETPAALSCRLWGLERTESTVCRPDDRCPAPIAQQWIRVSRCFLTSGYEKLCPKAGFLWSYWSLSLRGPHLHRTLPRL